ncbi:MAG: BlaI/MecI/CopY family transcriptional regulator [Phycisphaerae bacterium]|nr:BlaI/MecI/CopY family transcriptional regulator [Phycisphaerae bacterium]
MARPASKYPTQLELEILKILWRDGPANVRAVRDALAVSRDLAFTSVTTTMNIMTKKGFLRRSKDGPTWVYHPCVTQRATSRRMLGDLVDRLFDGSTALAMTNLLETSDINREELEKLQAMLIKKTQEESP